MTHKHTQAHTCTEPARVHAGRVRLAPRDAGPTADGRGREYDCLFIGAGRVRRIDGEDSNWLLPAEALRAAVPLFSGIPSYLDHPALFGMGWHQEPSLRDLAGVCFEPHWSEDEQGIAGILRLYDQDPTSAGAFIGAIYDQIIADRAAGVETPEIGLSAVIWQASELDEDAGLRVTTEIRRVDSVDHVYSAGARGYIRAALSRAGWGLSTGRPFYIPFSGATAPDCEREALRRTVGGSPMSEEIRGHESQPVSLGTPGSSPASPELAATLSAIDQRLAAIETRQAHQMDLAGAALADQTIEGMGTPPRAHVHGMQTGLDQVEQAVDALLAGVRPPAGIRPLSGIRELYTLLSGDYEMVGTFHSDQVYLANVTSTTMANLVANVLNKRVMIAFAQYPQWWAPIVTVENFTTLQQIRWITLGGIGELPTVAEGASYQEMTWDDMAQRSDFVKKGGYLGLTMEAIDKDDTRKIQMAPRALAQAAWLTLSKAIGEIFTANAGAGPNVYYNDASTRALFHSSNGNLGSSALSAAAWEATRIAMRKQAEHNSAERLGALTAPRYCLVPPDLEFTAIQALATEHIPGSADWNVNPEAQGSTHDMRLAAARERVIVVDLWTDTDNWAAAADPRLYPTIGLGFRYGSAPEVFSAADPNAGLMFTNDTMPVKVRFFFATGPIDYRGLFKHNV